MLNDSGACKIRPCKSFISSLATETSQSWHIIHLEARLERNVKSYLDCEKKFPGSLSPPEQAAELKACFVFIERRVCVWRLATHFHAECWHEEKLCWVTEGDYEELKRPDAGGAQSFVQTDASARWHGETWGIVRPTDRLDQIIIQVLCFLLIAKVDLLKVASCSWEESLSVFSWLCSTVCCFVCRLKLISKVSQMGHPCPRPVCVTSPLPFRKTLHTSGSRPRFKR